MSKSVLVVSSSPEGSDYLDKDNQDMVDRLLKGVKPDVDFLSGGQGKSFPEDVPKEKTYDMILFRDCNSRLFASVLKDYKKSIDLLKGILKQEGLVVISESKDFIEKNVSKKHYAAHKVTIKIDTLLKKQKDPSIKESEEFMPIVTYWNDSFKDLQTKQEKFEHKYIVYRGTKSSKKEATLVEEPMSSESDCLKKLEEIKGAIETTKSGGTKLGKAITGILDMSTPAKSKAAPPLTDSSDSNNSAQTPPPSFDPANADNRDIGKLNTLIGEALGAEYKPENESNDLIKNGYPRKIKPDPTIFKCEAYNISLECLNADGKNSDCFVHSFLITTCPNFRAAKIKDKEYLTYATNFRRKTLPLIVDFVFKQGDFVPESEEFTEKNIKEELTTESELLSDDLIKVLCYYYNISIVVIGKGNPRVAKVIYAKGKEAGSYPSAYVISNAHDVHWEPVRVIEKNRYLLTGDEVECIVTTYSGAAPNSENKKEKERAFKGMDAIKPMTEEQRKVYIAIEENKPGKVTQLFIDGNEDIKKLESLKDRLQAHYKEKGLAGSPGRGKQSDDISETIKDLQIDVSNGTAVDFEDIEKKVSEFINPPKKPGKKSRKGGGTQRNKGRKTRRGGKSRFA
jgi:hypothetical protein